MESDRQSVFTRPADGDIELWFTRIAKCLLCQSRLVVANQVHRIVEIECYYHSAEHPDPFPHQHPSQRLPHRWHFHRVGTGYRGGSFKGLDLSFGDGVNAAGILLRSAECPDGTLIDGPSLLVDHLLKRTGFRTVAELDRTLSSMNAWDEQSPLHLIENPAAEIAIHRSARVGLNPRTGSREELLYLRKEYRFLTEPRRIRKGRRELVQALHHRGYSKEWIARCTGSPLAAIRRYINSLPAAKDRI